MSSRLRTSPDRLGFPLFVIAAAQLMLVLDDSIANIALLRIQDTLKISASNLPWVLNGYVRTSS